MSFDHKRNPPLSWSLNAWENNLSLSVLIPFIRTLIEVEKNHLAIILSLIQELIRSFTHDQIKEKCLFYLSHHHPVKLWNISKSVQVSVRLLSVKAIKQNQLSLNKFPAWGCCYLESAYSKVLWLDTSCDKVWDFSLIPYIWAMVQVCVHLFVLQ